MSVKSLPIPDKSRREHGREASSDGGVVIPLQLRSSRLKMTNTRSDLEGERAERGRAMFKSRAGYIGALTRSNRATRKHRRTYGKQWNFGGLEVQAEIV